METAIDRNACRRPATFRTSAVAEVVVSG